MVLKPVCDGLLQPFTTFERRSMSASVQTMPRYWYLFLCADGDGSEGGCHSGFLLFWGWDQAEWQLVVGPNNICLWRENSQDESPCWKDLQQNVSPPPSHSWKAVSLFVYTPSAEKASTFCVMELGNTRSLGSFYILHSFSEEGSTTHGRISIPKKR